MGIGGCALLVNAGDDNGAIQLRLILLVGQKFSLHSPTDRTQHY